jgi:hypothetical protein
MHQGKDKDLVHPLVLTNLGKRAPFPCLTFHKLITYLLLSFVTLLDYVTRNLVHVNLYRYFDFDFDLYLL